MRIGSRSVMPRVKAGWQVRSTEKVLPDRLRSCGKSGRITLCAECLPDVNALFERLLSSCDGYWQSLL